VARARVPIPDDPLGYTDRTGQRPLSFQFALRLARTLAAAEPAAVLSFLDDTERGWNEDVRQPGNRWMAEYRVERRPGMEIARQWARSGTASDVMTETERLP
jgi:hypothetical protein